MPAQQQQLARHRREVALRRAIDVVGQHRGRDRVVVKESHGPGELVAVEGDRARLRGRGVQHLDRVGVALEVGQHRGEAWRELGEAGRAAFRRRAALEHDVERPFRVNGRVGAERAVGLHDAVEDDGGGVCGVVPHIVLYDPRAIGDAVERDPVVAEGDPHRLEIADRHARGVVLRPPGQVLPAGRRERADHARRRRRDVEVIGEVAGEAVGAARAALVQEHDVVAAGGGRERLGVASVEVAGRLPRAARDDKERWRVCPRIERAHDRDAERNALAGGIGGILGHLEVPAPGGHGACAARRGQPAVGEGDPAARRRTSRSPGGYRRQEQQQGREGGDGGRKPAVRGHADIVSFARGKRQAR